MDIKKVRIENQFLKQQIQDLEAQLAPKGILDTQGQHESIEIDHLKQQMVKLVSLTSDLDETNQKLEEKLD